VIEDLVRSKEALALLPSAGQVLRYPFKDGGIEPGGRRRGAHDALYIEIERVVVMLWAVETMVSNDTSYQ
jgi:hypothetical protein